MDIMRIKTDFLRKILSKKLTKLVKEKTEYDCDCYIHGIEISHQDKLMRAHVDFEVVATEEEVAKILARF